MISFRTGGGVFTGVIFNANGYATGTDATSSPMIGLSRAGCLAYAATNGWTVLAMY
jgi:hypothetical protein